jgi:hypothetical protein
LIQAVEQDARLRALRSGDSVENWRNYLESNVLINMRLPQQLQIPEEAELDPKLLAELVSLIDGRKLKGREPLQQLVLNIMAKAEQ